MGSRNRLQEGRCSKGQEYVQNELELNSFLKGCGSVIALRRNEALPFFE